MTQKQGILKYLRILVAFALGLLTTSCAAGGLLNDLLISIESSHPSISIGKINRGSLKEGKRLPSSGDNFETYSGVLSLLGRTHVNHRVRDLMLESYKTIAKQSKGVTFVYAETGHANGGEFWPHRTHQTGLSVDFVVPVKDQKTGEPGRLGCWPWNGYCYRIAADKNGRIKGSDEEIDFDALALHLWSLNTLAKKHGLKVNRVILAPDLRKKLFKAKKYGAYVKEHIRFKKKRAWVRHDDHYHVDFAVR